MCPDKFQKCQEEDCDCLPLSGDWPVGARPGKKQQHNGKLYVSLWFRFKNATLDVGAKFIYLRFIIIAKNVLSCVQTNKLW